MIIERHKHHSRHLGREMRYNIYGTEGHPVLVFPSQDGRYFDYEDNGMTDALSEFIDSGKIRLICADSIDKETWSNDTRDPRLRIELHEKWFNYIIEELIPEVSHGIETFMVTGCSMGGFHSSIFFFRRPDLFDTMISLSGIYHADFFIKDYFDRLLYKNSVLHFLEDMPEDHPYLRIYRERRIVCCVGQGELEEDIEYNTHELEDLLNAMQIPNWIEFWGKEVDHDWVWWKKQIYHFMRRLV